ncbi:hypothetical protein H2248_003017 [Termitomyces sp. 'cryptogamus']|nr:hypothetical protein H2248_003017 [Termitomyces sp. 'cryptogamus']
MPKKTSRSSKHTPLGGRTTPTGVRRFFFKLELLGKRRTGLPFDYSNLDPIVNTPPEKDPARDPFDSSRIYGKENKTSPPPPAPGPTRPIHNVPWPKRVALINEDHTENAIVITTLDTVPFCCHEDLITMSRKQLIGVALALNARLPAALAIDTNEALATSWIRTSIERIVGIRTDVPGAPRMVKVLTDLNGALEKKRTGAGLGGGLRRKMDRTPPTSPLASRSQHLGSLVSPGLDRLVEEDEGDDDDEADRHSKKRKFPFEETGEESDSDVVMDSNSEQTPTPLPRRARSCFLSVRISPSPTLTRVLRSHSQMIGRVPTIDTSFMFGGRPQARYQRKPTKDKVKARTNQEALPPIGAPRRSGRLRPISRLPALLPAELSTAPHSESAIGTKTKRNVSGFGRVAAQHVTSGFDKMTMRSGSESDFDGMDISSV